MAAHNDRLRDLPLTPRQLEDLRLQLSRLSLTALHDAYYAAWTRCKMHPDGMLPKARFVQELVQAWKAIRKLRS